MYRGSMKSIFAWILRFKCTPRNVLFVATFFMLLYILNVVFHPSVFRHRQAPDDDDDETDDIFREKISREEKLLFRSLLQTFDELSGEADLSYMLAGGSLVGSVRHHGMVPWDDEVTLAILQHQIPNLHKLFKLLPRNMRGESYGDQWRVFYEDRPRIRPGRGNSTFPYLEINRYVVSKGYITDIQTDMDYIFNVSVNMVLPAVKRPFMKLKLPVPRQTEEFLLEYFRVDVMTHCSGSSQEHRLDDQDHPSYYSAQFCEDLWPKFPFVHRVISNPAERKYNETLVADGRVVYSVQALY